VKQESSIRIYKQQLIQKGSSPESPPYEHAYKDLRSASAAKYYLVFKAVIAAQNELLFTNPY
jgi:hypothetical protein